MNNKPIIEELKNGQYAIKLYNRLLPYIFDVKFLAQHYIDYYINSKLPFEQIYLSWVNEYFENNHVSIQTFKGVDNLCIKMLEEYFQDLDDVEEKEYILTERELSKYGACSLITWILHHERYMITEKK